MQPDQFDLARCTALTLPEPRHRSIEAATAVLHDRTVSGRCAGFRTTRNGFQTQQAADVRLSSGLPGRQLKSSGDNFMQLTASGGKLRP